uniref:Uncharacterized protein n=1 Tax=Anopheles epiroticus TaxID=199890 RepID=A0A182PCM7_9DIPT
MKVALCLLAVLAVALARPQNYGQQFWPEALQRAQQQRIIRPDETLISGLQVAPLVNQLENVPFDQPVSIDQIVQLDEPAVYAPLQRSVSETLARIIMKVAICLFAVIALALAAPQRDGGALTDEAIRQAQSQQLIPQDAQIQGVQQGIQVAALESIPGSQRVDLFQLLGDQVPREVISNLQSQVDQVGQV